MFHRFFLCFLARSRYLCLFLLCFIFNLLRRQSTQFGRFTYLLTVFSSGRLAEISWSVCISKSERRLWVSISWTHSELGVYHSFLRSNLNLHNCQWIIFTIQSCLVLYFFTQIYGICLLYDWSFHFNHHKTQTGYFIAYCLFFFFFFCQRFFFLMALFCVAIWRESVYL